MDIDSFLAENRGKWQRLEEVSTQGRRGLAKLSGEEIQEVLALYLSTSADLSEAQTRYGDPRLSGYLARVVALANSALYSSRPRTLRGLVALFGPRYRRAIRQTIPHILLAAVLFTAVTAASLAWVSSSAAARSGLLPPQARAAIEKAGGSRPDFEISPATISGLIFLNNARVALLAFALGITLGAGTVWIVAYNGFIIGALGAGYAVVGKAGIFWSLIAPHGILEVTAICIAAGAGFRIGWSIVNPGDRPRLKSLAEESTEAIIVVIGVLPAFLIAALIEGLLTGTSVPVPVQILVGVAAEVALLLFLFGKPAGINEPATV